MKRFSMEQAADMESDMIDFDDALEEYKSDMVFHKCEDKTVNNLMRKFSDRAISSNKKHGDKIHEVNKSNIQWVTEALEECMDMCVYLERLLEKLQMDTEQERRGNVRNLS
mgnify:FL=1|tara:strand:+ start:6041 stop:6373 length:333 start_codon:yes stop_codon:yes gene_type:complete